MPSFDSYSADDRLRLLLQGPPGSTKSSLLFQVPDNWIFDLDHNLGGPMRFAREHGLPLPLGYDVVDIDDDGKPVDKKNRWAVFDKKLKRVQADPKVKAISIDSGTIFADMLVTEVLRSQGKEAISDYKDGRQFWGFYAVAGKQLMSTLMNMRKHIFLTIHERTDTDEKGNVVYPIKVTWPGQVGEIISLFFTDNWRIQLERKAATKPGMPVEYEQILTTMPSYQYALKNSLGLPEKFRFDWKLIESKLAGGTKP